MAAGREELYVYVLKLEDEKYYVGSTTNPLRRIEQHRAGEGAEWTRMYRMRQIIELKRGSLYDEVELTMQLMRKYGEENVRGGSFCESSITDRSANIQQRMVSHLSDLCYRCQSSGHYAANCPLINGALECADDVDIVDDIVTPQAQLPPTPAPTPARTLTQVRPATKYFCHFCGHNSHNIDMCRVTKLCMKCNKKHLGMNPCPHYVQFFK